MHDALSLADCLVSLPLRTRSRALRALYALSQGLGVLTGGTPATAVWHLGRCVLAHAAHVGCRAPWLGGEQIGAPPMGRRHLHL